jgi:ketosteroid isomerase-like protein
MGAPEPFDSDQIRAAERRVTDALAAPDVTARVYEYTEDAVLLEPAASRCHESSFTVHRPFPGDMATGSYPLSIATGYD